MQRVLVLCLALLGAAGCASETTEPDLRSVRAPESPGKPVYSDYVLTLFAPDGSIVRLDTLHVEPDGRISQGLEGLHTVLRVGGTWPYLPSLPWEKGESVSLQFLAGVVDSYWLPTIDPPPPFTRVGPCTLAEEAFRGNTDPVFASLDCREPIIFGVIQLFGTVQPNGSVEGTFNSHFENSDPQVPSSGSFTLIPIRGRGHTISWPEPEPVTYALVTEEILVAPGSSFSVFGQVTVLGSDGYYLRTNPEHLSYALPDGCTPLEPEAPSYVDVTCTELEDPTTIVVTVLPGAQWFTFEGEPVEVDVTGQQVTVEVWSIDGWNAHFAANP